MKITWLILGIVAFGMIYIIFVNKASTRWYFHKIESNNLDAVMFDYNLVKLEVMQAEKKLWNDVSLSVSQQDPIKILTDVVTITHRGVAFQ